METLLLVCVCVRVCVRDHTAKGVINHKTLTPGWLHSMGVAGSNPRLRETERHSRSYLSTHAAVDRSLDVAPLNSSCVR